MFNDTQAITIAGGLNNFTRKGTVNPAALGKFTSPDGNYILEVRQKSTKNRKRSEFVITSRKIASDPLTAVMGEISFSCGVYIDQPKTGFNHVTEVDPVFVGMITNIMSGTQLAKLVSGDT